MREYKIPQSMPEMEPNFLNSVFELCWKLSIKPWLTIYEWFKYNFILLRYKITKKIYKRYIAAIAIKEQKD